ncbi:armadillo-type protein [Massariosphaeria phaeospora]|uniref:Armadillo-type protein n=1 Tax=Massariosphaeria phaeospora TaxID=100035 RepID=A0A7C8IB67_9PLEO|nr:armadillo-type protein [Massariosphaeria phaeospora]
MSRNHARGSARKDVVDSLTKLHQSLQGIDARPGAFDAKLAEYVFVPISQVLRASRTVPVRALELCLECISVLLRTGWGGGLAPELAGQLLILFTFMAKPSSAENGIEATSEELRKAAFICISQLLTELSHTSQGRQFLVATSNIPALGEAVLVTLDSLTEDVPNAVKIEALSAVMALVSAIEDRDALASFLPRIISSLTKLLTPGSKNRAGFRVLERGLETLSLLFPRILSDRETKKLPAKASQDESQNKVSRTSSWLQATASQIKIALSHILKLRSHSKIEVRRALLELCLIVIRDCRASLVECISMVVETMVTLVGSGESQDRIEHDLRALVRSDSAVAGLLKESLHSWIISLPRLMQSKDDIGRRQIIQQVSVALRLLNEDQNMVVDILADNLRSGVSNIMNDAKGLLVESATSTTIGTELSLSNARSTSFQPLKLRLKGQDTMMGEFKLLLQELSKSDAARTVAQDLIESADTGTSEAQLASFWISINLLRDMMTYNPAIDDFLDIGTANMQAELLDDLYSRALVRLTQPHTQSDWHWHFQALALEVVALQATRYKSEFRAELGETLYPVLHQLGSSNPELRNHAITCLNILAESCGYDNASDLVVSNVDYIVNDVGLRLNVGDVAPQAPQVLLMMMRLCGPSLLPYLDDLVGSMFGALERFHGYPKLVELLFAVLRGMAEEGVKAPQLAITGNADETQHQTREKVTDMSDVVDAIKKLREEILNRSDEQEEVPHDSFPHEPWKEDQKGKEEQNPPQDDDNHNPPEQPEPPPPAARTYAILLKISELTQHYLTSSSPTLRTSLLSLLHTTIPALAKHDNSFLPLINTLWPVLLPRLEDPEAYIVSNALDIVALICTHAGNFMKTRVESAWGLFKMLHRRVNRKTDNHSSRSSGKAHGSLHSANLNLNITPLHHDLSTLTLSTPAPSPSSTSLDAFRPELYTDAPTRMIRESFITMLCAVSRHVAVHEELFYELLDMLEPVVARPDVKAALKQRNADAVWLRLWKKSQRAGK